jgi:hypothetical protein
MTLVAANLLQINTNLKLRIRINQLNDENRLLENKISSSVTEDQLIGTVINNVSLEALQPATRQGDNIAFKLLAFFSWKDCSSCLTEETLRWREVHGNHKIPVFAVCVDNDSGAAYGYRAKYNPSFPVLNDLEKSFEKIKAQRTPLVLLLNDQNKIILAQIAEAGNDAKREKFYYQVSQIVRSAR